MAEIANGDFLSTARQNGRTVSQMKEKMTQLSCPGTSPEACPDLPGFRWSILVS
jgi:hypothetical protein